MCDTDGDQLWQCDPKGEESRGIRLLEMKIMGRKMKHINRAVTLELEKKQNSKLGTKSEVQKRGCRSDFGYHVHGSVLK